MHPPAPTCKLHLQLHNLQMRWLHSSTMRPGVGGPRVLPVQQQGTLRQTQGALQGPPCVSRG